MSSFVRTGGSAIKQLKIRTSDDKTRRVAGFLIDLAGFDRPRDGCSRIKCSETVDYIFKEVAIVVKLLTVVLKEITEEWLGMIFFGVIKMTGRHSEW